MFISRLILIALVIDCSLSGMVCAQSKSQINNEQARYVLDKMLASRTKMRNLQFEYEQIVWRNLDIVNTKYFINPKDETIYGKHRMVLDCNGLGKKDYYEYGIVDLSGKKVPVETLLRNRAWDGHIGIEHNHHGDTPGRAILTDSPPHSLIHEIQPWRYFTGFFVEYLAKAINEARHPVSVEILPDGKYQVGYLCSANNAEFVSIIDPEKGFTCTKLTSFYDGIKRGCSTAEYEEFADGVWFPVIGEYVIVTSDGVVTRKSSFRMSNIRVNDPNFSKDLFHIDLPKGTRVTDKVLGIRYIVDEPMSMKTYPDGISFVGATWLDGFGKDALNLLKDKRLPDMKQFAVLQDPNEAKDKMILVCFLDMDQRPSRHCITQLAKQARHLKEKGVIVVAVQASKSDDNKIKEWVKKNNIPFSVGMIQGDEEKTRFTWGVRSLPWLILTDKQHVVRAEGFGLEQLDEKLQETSSNVIRPERLATDQAGTRVVDEEYGDGAEMPAPSTVGPVGQRALLFDGVDDCLHVPDSPTLELKPPFTIEMWIKPDFSDIRQKMNAETLISGKKGIHWLGLMRKSKKTAEPERPLSGGFVMFVQPSSRPEHSCYGSLYLGTAKGILFQEDMFVGERLETGQPGWLRVSASCRRSEKYVPVPDEPLVIGNPFFKGEIAEIRIWNKVFTRSDPCGYEDTALTGNEPNLVACWDFEHTEGQMVYDISPNGNHAYMGTSKEADNADPIWVSPYAIPYQSDQKTDME